MTKDKKIENVEFGVDSRYQSNSERKVDGKALMEARLSGQDCNSQKKVLEECHKSN